MQEKQMVLSKGAKASPEENHKMYQLKTIYYTIYRQLKLDLHNLYTKTTKVKQHSILPLNVTPVSQPHVNIQPIYYIISGLL